MSLARNLRHPIESIRSAPLGALFGSVNIGGGAWDIIALTEANTTLARGLYAGAFVLNALAVVISGGVLMKRQLALRDRLEASIETHGYNDRIMSPTTDEWCNRQTARVVCEKYDTLAQYLALCEERSDTATLTRWPHC